MESFPMCSSIRYLFTSTIVAAILLGQGLAVAQKPKPGGSTPPPPGIIYFRHDGNLWQMDAAGTPASRVRLSAAPDGGEPSHNRHGNQRWFVYRQWLPWEFPNGHQAYDLRAGSDGGADVLLLANANIEVLSEPVWAADDASVSFIGARWDLDANNELVVVEAGVYELTVSFVSGTPVPGPLNFLADLSGPLNVAADGFTEVLGHSWNPDRTAVAFNVYASGSGTAIWILDLAMVTDPSNVPAAAFWLLASGRGACQPRWSPDGSRIGYATDDGAVVYDVSTGRKKLLKRTTSTNWGPTEWSPDGAYFAVDRWNGLLPGGQGNDAIFRFTADLGGKTELTVGFSTPGHNVLTPVGWRY
jgi:hypothetical protein